MYIFVFPRLSVCRHAALTMTYLIAQSAKLKWDSSEFADFVPELQFGPLAVGGKYTMLRFCNALCNVFFALWRFRRSSCKHCKLLCIYFDKTFRVDCRTASCSSCYCLLLLFFSCCLLLLCRQAFSYSTAFGLLYSASLFFISSSFNAKTCLSSVLHPFVQFQFFVVAAAFMF